MMETLRRNDHASAAEHLYRRGQHIIYKGEDAQILEVKPVFTIRISGKSHVICGNIFQDIQPTPDEDA